MQSIRENVHVLDNVNVMLTDIHTGAQRSFSAHNIPLNYQFQALSRWIAGVNNTGQNAVLPPSQIVYGSGSGTPEVIDPGPFTAIAGSATKLSYATANSPSNGTTTLVFQTPAGVVTTQVTEAFLEDANSNGWAHLMFGAPFTPSSTETITTQWELTYSN